jgi:hypothetical protein
MSYFRRAAGLLPWYFSLSVVVAVPFTAIAILSLCGPPKTGPFSVRVRENVRGLVEGNGSS